MRRRSEGDQAQLQGEVMRLSGEVTESAGKLQEAEREASATLEVRLTVSVNQAASRNELERRCMSY